MLDLTDFGVQFRYEVMDECREPLDRATIRDEVGALVTHVASLID